MTTFATNEKGRASRAPAGTKQRHPESYPLPRGQSSRIPCRRKWLTDALALLVLGLQRDDLHPSQRWLTELVDARIVRGAA